MGTGGELLHVQPEQGDGAVGVGRSHADLGVRAIMAVTCELPGLQLLWVVV